MSAREPDMGRLKEIAAELDALIARGALTRQEWERLRDAADVASNGDGRALEFIYNEADPSWVPASED